MPPPKKIRIRPEVSAALGEWNMQQTGRGINATGYVTDPEVIARLVGLALPGEDFNDTIMRVLRGGVSTAMN